MTIAVIFLFVNVCLQCSSVDPTNVTAVDRCAERLSHAATHSLSLPDDVSATVSLLQTMIEILAEDEAHPPSLETSQVTHNVMILYCSIFFSELGGSCQSTFE